MMLSTEAKVGSISLVGFLLLAFMIIQLGGFSFGDDGYPVQAVFSQVNGLKEGNLVRYAGVEVGRVQSVKIQPDGVRVQLLINPGVKIPQDAKFNIGTDGLLGEKYIDIVPPPRPTSYLEPNSIVRGEDPQGLDKMIATADKVLADVQKLVNSLNDVFGDEKVKAALKDSALNVGEITANLSQFSATLARMAANNEQDINGMVSNLHVMSASLRDVAARVDKLVANFDNNGQTASDLRAAIANLKTTSARVEKMAASLEGVVTDPQTAADIKDTLHNAREVSAKANKMLSKVDSVSAQTGFEVLYNNDTNNYQTNANIKINTSPRDFAVIGVTDIGEGDKGNFQVGHGTEQFAGRAGVIDGEVGVGVDTRLGKQLKLSLDAYDPNDVRVKLRTQYEVAPDTFIVGQADNLNEDARSTSLGLRKSF